MQNNYDRIAPVYDLLSKIIFGNALIDSQKCMLHHIPANSNVLIVGGGTGFILEEIAKIHPQGLTISYVEISQKMIQFSKKRHTAKNSIVFINEAVEDFNTSNKFDIIITPFLFDNFQVDKIKSIINQLDAFLNPHGYWLYADFKSEKIWQKLLLSSMYKFFSIVSNIDANKLIEVHTFFNEYKRVFECTHYNGFLQSIVYKKN